jgi:hypothetical protein
MPRKKATPAQTLTHDGVTLTLVEWAKRTDQSASCLRNRLRLGWSITEALCTPRRPIANHMMRPQVTERLNDAFDKLVHDVDRALRAFQRRMNAVLNEPVADPPVFDNFDKHRPDQSSPSAPDSL